MSTQIQIAQTKGRCESFYTMKSGMCYNIYTSKSGNSVRCSAMIGEKGTMGIGSFSFMMYDKRNFDCLYKEEGRATDKKVMEVHQKGIEVFMEKMATLDVETFSPQIGQILFTTEPGQNNRAIYDVLGLNRYRSVYLDGSKTCYDDHVRDYDDKFGIGSYYIKGETISQEKVNELLQQAQESERKKNEAMELAAAEAKQERLKKIEIGAKAVKELPDFKSVIFACESWFSTPDGCDYGGYSKGDQIIILHLSKSDRISFAEMRKHAGKFHETAHLAGSDPSNEDRSSLRDWCLQNDESLWAVMQNKYMKLTLEDLQIAAAEGRYLHDSEVKTEPGNRPGPVKVPVGEIEIIDYSERSIAVIGDTKPIKEELKSIGGRFNFRLTCGAGWVFPKSKIDEVVALLGSIGSRS